MLATSRIALKRRANMEIPVESFDVPSAQDRGSAAEWEARLELAAAYRMVAHFGWTHLVQNQISLRVPGTDNQFLINPYGFLYEQITASSLSKIDCDGKPVDETPLQVNETGFVIHSAVHMARPELHCAIHTYIVAGMAVSSLRDGLLPLNQGAMRWYNRIAIHAFEGLDVDERQRLIADLGQHKCMILRHHGLLTAGSNVGDAITLMHHLEKACQTQMMVLASNADYDLPPPELCEHTAQQFYRNNRVLGQRDWAALRALCDDRYPSYRN
jgi:ribulose-5-phosphate 4-epimerase/fuculose-1-phosphate aldolase